jgi:hypothetical protein
MQRYAGADAHALWASLAESRPNPYEAGIGLHCIDGVSHPSFSIRLRQRRLCWSKVSTMRCTKSASARTHTVRRTGPAMRLHHLLFSPSATLVRPLPLELGRCCRAAKTSTYTVYTCV